MSQTGGYPDAWVTFLNLRKSWAYRQDQLPSTHPIATDMVDLEAVKLNFDGITYAKGASALRQLVAWVGVDNFLTGLRAYFQAHRWGNTTLADLLIELEATSGRDLSTWTQQWLRTAGVNLLRPEVAISDGRYTRVAVRQEPPVLPEGLPPILRSHRIRIGCYQVSDQLGADTGRRVLTRTGLVELDVSGEVTEVPELVGMPVPDLLLLNDDDLTFAKVRLDPHSLETARAHFGDLADSMPRTLIWGAAWDMARDAELGAGEYLDLVLSGLPAETDIGVVSQTMRQARTAIELFAAPGHVAEYRERFAAAMYRDALAAEPGSDHQLAYVRALAGAARSPEHLALISGLLSGEQELPGLNVDTDLRWNLLGRLVALGLAGEDAIDEELHRDPTAIGRRHAVASRASIPTAAAKRAAWDCVIHDLTLPNALMEATMAGFAIPEQQQLLAPFATEYFEVIEEVWAARSHEMSAMIAHGLYPSLIVAESTVAATNEFLARADLPAGLRRVISEGRDGVERSLRCRARDA
jgi:aminopeptidase N